MGQALERLLLAAILAVGFGCPGRPSPVGHWAQGFVTPAGAQLESGTDPARPVVLVFWSSWSTPCQPLLSEARGWAEKARVIAVLAEPDRPAEAATVAGLEAAMVRDLDVAKRLNVEVLPTTLVLGPHGNGAGRFEGYGPKVCSLVAGIIDSLAGQ